LGCDDFRSTKRSITFATLVEPDNNGGGGSAGIRILGGGTQHIRACVEDDRVRLCVLDASDGSAVGLGEWQHNYGRGKPIKKGDTVEASMTFELIGPMRRR